MTEYLTVKQFAKMTGYHPNWFYINKDRFEYVRFGRKILISEENVEAFLSDHSIKPEIRRPF